MQHCAVIDNTEHGSDQECERAQHEGAPSDLNAKHVPVRIGCAELNEQQADGPDSGKGSECDLRRCDDWTVLQRGGLGTRLELWWIVLANFAIRAVSYFRASHRGQRPSLDECSGMDQNRVGRVPRTRHRCCVIVGNCHASTDPSCGDAGEAHQRRPSPVPKRASGAVGLP